MKNYLNCLVFIILIGLLMETQCNKYYIDKDFNINNENIENYVAWADYEDNLSKTGWLNLKIFTNKDHNDNTQFFMAGYLEGYLTQNYIYDAYSNFIFGQLNGKSELKEGAKDFISNQLKWIENQINKNKEDNYWKLVDGLMNQLKGMYKGYIDKVVKEKKPEEYLEFFNFYYLTNMGDLEDIIPAFEVEHSKDPRFLECSGFIKLDKDLITSHNTHNIYSLMLRIFKSYHFNLNNPSIKAKSMSYSARPGDLESKDDYYVLSSNLVVIESSLNNYNESLYQYIKSDALPVWIRVNLANRFAENSKNWTDFFEIHNGGTHNNQWAIVDYNKYWEYQKKGEIKNSQDIVWLIEQFFYIVEKEDVTQKFLVKDGYFATYNFPYFHNIFEIGNYKEKNPKDPREEIFKNQANTTHNIEDVKKLILLNKNETGNPGISIAPRWDLALDNPTAFGAIDGKAIDGELLKKGYTWIYSSPTHDDLPPFNFKQFEKTPHRGIPEIMDFDWVLTNINE